MKTHILKLVAILIITSSHQLINTSSFAQAPEMFNYQNVVRDNSGNILANQPVSYRINILQGSVYGASVYVETQKDTTNTYGVSALKIGDGVPLYGSMSDINWANGPYYIRVDFDQNGGSSYMIMGTTQLLSVPYALHANTAETLTGGITETDPIFGASLAYGIVSGDISNWNTAYGWGNHATAGYLTSYTETDPIWTATSSNYYTKSNMQSSGSAQLHFNNLTNKPTTLAGHGITNAMSTSHAANAISATNISNWNTAFGWGNHATEGYLTSFTETDPRIPSGTQAGEMQYWNGTEWVTVAAGNEGQMLSFVGGVPTWITVGGVATLVPTDVYNPTTGKVWMDRNLGASQVATSSTDAAAYGDLYQWGRGTDGHEKRSSGTTSALATSDTPGHGDFITNNSSSPYDWRSPQNTNLWQGISGTNNPCPSGYRLPTEAEWAAERLSWSNYNAAGAFASPLKLPVAGHRDRSNGLLYFVDSYGYYWSSSVDGTDSRCLYFSSSPAGMLSRYRAYGFSGRCLKD